MLNVAAQRSPAIEWKQGTAESLPSPDESFDVVVSQFALMFFADAEKAIREMLRVLVSGGRLAVAVWDTLENNKAYLAETELLRRTIGEHAADTIRVPYAFGDRSALTSLFAGAGLPSATITTYKGTGRFPSIRSMVEHDLYGWLPIMGVVPTQDEIDRVLGEAEGALGSYTTPEGKVAFECSAHIITAKKP